MSITVSIKEHVNALVCQILPEQPQADDLFLVDVLVGGSKAVSKITVLLDGDHGVGIDACARISRQLGHALEEANVLEMAYTLEVSSPGLDLPLQSPRQYAKNVGRRVRVVLADGTEQSGTLTEVSEGGIRLEPDEQKRGKSPRATDPQPVAAPPPLLGWERIKQTFVLVSF